MSLVCCGCENVGVILTPRRTETNTYSNYYQVSKNLKAIVSGGVGVWGCQLFGVASYLISINRSGCRLFVVAVGMLE